MGNNKEENMITLIKHDKIIHNSGTGFSIVEAKVTLGKLIGKGFNSKFDRVFHEGDKKAIKIKSILWQYGEKPTINDLEKRFKLNKNTVFTKPRDIIKEMFK